MEKLAHPKCVEDDLDVVELADGDADGREQDVEGKRLGGPLPSFFGCVARDTKDNRFAACVTDTAGEGIGARVDDLRARRNLIDVNQLVPGGDNRYPWAPENVHHRTVQRGKHAEVRRREHLSRAHHQLVTLEILTVRPHEGASLGRCKDLGERLGRARTLHLYYGVSPRGNWCASHRARRLTPPDRDVPPRARPPP